MHERFNGRLQVSKYERFGYGVMVMYCAATGPGVRMLYETGLVATFLEVFRG
jgi:hypothetical protein